MKYVTRKTHCGPTLIRILLWFYYTRSVTSLRSSDVGSSDSFVLSTSVNVAVMPSLTPPAISPDVVPTSRSSDVGTGIFNLNLSPPADGAVINPDVNTIVPPTSTPVVSVVPGTTASTIQEEHCYVCGSLSSFMDHYSSLVTINTKTYTCGEIYVAGIQGTIPMNECELFQDKSIQTTCGCSTLESLNDEIGTSTVTTTTTTVSTSVGNELDEVIEATKKKQRMNRGKRRSNMKRMNSNSKVRGSKPTEPTSSSDSDSFLDTTDTTETTSTTELTALQLLRLRSPVGTRPTPMISRTDNTPSPQSSLLISPTERLSGAERLPPLLDNLNTDSGTTTATLISPAPQLQITSTTPKDKSKNGGNNMKAMQRLVPSTTPLTTSKSNTIQTYTPTSSEIPTISSQPTYNVKCNTCGSETEIVSKRDKTFEFGGTEHNCGAAYDAGINGFIEPTLCEAITQAVQRYCKCKSSVSKEEEKTDSLVISKDDVVAGVVNPIPAPIINIDTTTTFAPTKSASPTITVSPTGSIKCYTCGDASKYVTDPMRTVTLSGTLHLCGEVDSAGRKGYINPMLCYDVTVAVQRDCQCSTIVVPDTFQQVLPTTTVAPTFAPIPLPVVTATPVQQLILSDTPSLFPSSSPIATYMPTQIPSDSPSLVPSTSPIATYRPTKSEMPTSTTAPTYSEFCYTCGLTDNGSDSNGNTNIKHRVVMNRNEIIEVFDKQHYCGDVYDAGMKGFIPPEMCSDISQAVQTKCNCV